MRVVGNVFSTRERVAKIFGIADPKEMKFKCLEALENTISLERGGETAAQFRSRQVVLGTC